MVSEMGKGTGGGGGESPECSDMIRKVSGNFVFSLDTVFVFRKRISTFVILVIQFWV